MQYTVFLYCPYDPDLQEFPVTVDAPTEELARKKILGKTVTCPSGHAFEVEDFFIIRVYPSKTVPPPPYKLMPEEDVKRAKWLKPAIVEEPLPLGAKPKGSPKLAATIKNAVVTLLYEQPVESKAIQFVEYYPAFTVKRGNREITYGPYYRGDIVYLPVKKAKELVDAGFARWAYPDYKGKVLYRFDIFTKFYEEAKRMARQRKLEEATIYLIEHAPGISLRVLADCLGAGYWTLWRIIAKYARPEEWELKKVERALSESATLERWLPKQKDEIVAELKKPKAPRILVGPLVRGSLTFYPAKWKTEKELLQELNRILTIERYPTLTPEEEKVMRDKIREYWETKRKENITYYFAREEEEEE